MKSKADEIYNPTDLSYNLESDTYSLVITYLCYGVDNLDILPATPAHPHEGSGNRPSLRASLSIVFGDFPVVLSLYSRLPTTLRGYIYIYIYIHICMSLSIICQSAVTGGGLSFQAPEGQQEPAGSAERPTAGLNDKSNTYIHNQKTIHIHIHIHT